MCDRHEKIPPCESKLSSRKSLGSINSSAIVLSPSLTVHLATFIPLFFSCSSSILQVPFYWAPEAHNQCRQIISPLWTSVDSSIKIRGCIVKILKVSSISSLWSLDSFKDTHPSRPSSKAASSSKHSLTSSSQLLEVNCSFYALSVQLIIPFTLPSFYNG